MINGSPVTVEGGVNNLLDPEFDLRVSSPQLDVDKFLTQFLPEKKLPFTGLTQLDFSITGQAANRMEAFGQIDHVRLYGFDIEHRLKFAGFKVEQVIVRDFDLREIGRYSMNHASGSELFLCVK